MKIMNIFGEDTICAISTASGTAAIAVIRLSGPRSHEIALSIFTRHGKTLNINDIRAYGVYYGEIKDPDEDTAVDDVLMTFFKAPHSYTGEDSVEISCHGSQYIQQRIMELLVQRGARLARGGEYTMRAFANKKMDLVQAEAVADLIASRSREAHDMAVAQMRGGFSKKINELRQQLIDFTALIELELDFSEEDVEFADRELFKVLIESLKQEIKQLTDSFKTGNAIKNGIPVAIVGKPNVGKSTLLNALLHEDRAIVSDIPGTTRDSIEDTYVINGHTFRFIDTAGLRKVDDVVENIGIERTYRKMNEAVIILYMCNITEFDIMELKEFEQYINNKDKHFILVANKTDLLDKNTSLEINIPNIDVVYISAKKKDNIQQITDMLASQAEKMYSEQDVIVSNVRHHEALTRTYSDLEAIEKGMDDGIPTDLMTTDIRAALFHLGSITGEITTDDVLQSVFSRFCIGK